MKLEGTCDTNVLMQNGDGSETGQKLSQQLQLINRNAT